MRVDEIMTSDPACCTPDSTLEEAARLMIDNDCGEIPVVENFDNFRPVGVITDRDITCRSVGRGLNPLEMRVEECMTSPIVFVRPDSDMYDCYLLMEENQIRRLPVVDAAGSCVGIVALADIAKKASKADSGEILKDVSASTGSASAVA